MVKSMRSQLKNWKNYKSLKILMEVSDYEVLMTAKGNRSWHAFVKDMQASKPKSPRPQPPDFRSEPARYVRYRKTATLRRLGLNKSKVCRFCFSKCYSNPQPLEQRNFVALIAARMPDVLVAFGITDEALRLRFEEQSLPAEALCCPRCSAYANIRTFGELLDSIIPELSQQQLLNEIKEHQQGSL